MNAWWFKSKIDQNDPDYEFFRGRAALPDCALLPVTRAASQFSVASSNWSQKKKKRKSSPMKQKERVRSSGESRDWALNLQSLTLSAASPPQSHVKNYTAAPASRQLQSGVYEWRLCRTGWHSPHWHPQRSLQFTAQGLLSDESKSWARSQGALSVSLGHNYIKYNHSGPNC